MVNLARHTRTNANAKVGGQLLGEGGCGRVLTIDELPFKNRLSYDVMGVNIGGGGLYVIGWAGSMRDLCRILGMNAMQMMASVVFKTSLNPDDSSDEVNRTTDMLTAVAQLRKQAAWDTLARTTPMIQLRNGSFAVALKEVRDKKDAHLMPLYMRMHGNLYELRYTITIPDLLHAIKSVLDALCVLREAGVHHGDIKDENVLWRILGDGTASFVLSDFGHLKHRPHQNAAASLSGTEGFMSPLMYGRDTAAMRLFESHMRIPNVQIDAVAVWKTYQRTGRLSPAQQFEKNDLYAIGIMFYEAFHPPNTPNKDVLSLARSLVDGSKNTGVWTVSDARKRLQLLLT